MNIFYRFRVRFIVMLMSLIIINLSVSFITQNEILAKLFRENMEKNGVLLEKLVGRELVQMEEQVTSIGKILSRNDLLTEYLEIKDYENIQNIISGYVQDFNDFEIEIFDFNGNLVSKGINVQKNFEDIDLIKKAIADQYVFTDYIYKNNKLYIANLSTVRGNSGNLGVILVKYEIKAEFFNRLNESRNSIISIIDETDKIYVSNSSSPLIKNDEAVKTNNYIEFKRKLSDNNFILSIHYSLEKTKKTQRISGFKIWYINITFIIISFILLNYMSKSILEPMNQLVNGMNELGKGNFNYRISKTSNSEMGNAMKVFNLTSKKLKENIVREKRFASLDKIASAGRLASSIAHEIKNPLSSISMIVDMYNQRFESIEFKKDDFEVISGEIKRINEIIQRLVDFAKNEKISIDEISLVKIINEMISLTRNKAQKSNTKLEFDYSSEIMIRADKNLVKQFLLNIILNSIDATEEGMIKIELFENDEIITLKISDNGKGIKKDILSKILEPFYTTKVSGSGIGLAVVKKILDIHEFEFDIQSEENEYTIFSVFINKERNAKLEPEIFDYGMDIFERREI